MPWQIRLLLELQLTCAILGTIVRSTVSLLRICKIRTGSFLYRYQYCFICVTCFMQLQSIMYIGLIVVVDPRYHHRAIQSILCCAYINYLTCDFHQPHVAFRYRDLGPTTESTAPRNTFSCKQNPEEVQSRPRNCCYDVDNMRNAGRKALVWRVWRKKRKKKKKKKKLTKINSN